MIKAMVPNRFGLSFLGKRSLSTTYSCLKILLSERTAVIELHRPQALNALNCELMGELASAMKEIDSDPSYAAVVITGSEKSFAAGADISEMAPKTFSECYSSDFLSNWPEIFSSFRKPVIAAVNGFALGGGCELAMMCDIIYAGSRAKFSQPEIKLGTLPGGGGTQRLARAIGKSKAMEMILTGRHINAEEAERIGLVSKVFPPEDLVKEAIKVANEMGKFSLPALIMCKESVNKAFETSLSDGIHFERRLFQSSFGLYDRKEGMTAFIEKRSPVFLDK